MKLDIEHIFINIDIDERSLIFNDQVNKYFYILNKEIDEVLNSLELTSEFKTIYIATSSDISGYQELVVDLLSKLENKLSFAEDIEISLEIFPGSNWDFEVLALARVNRLIIKQISSSTDNNFKELVTAARNAGIDNISCDILYNFPGQTRAAIREDLAEIIDNDIKHIYISDASIVLDFDYEDKEREFYHYIIENLEAAGYEHYELFALAKIGYESKHNLAYWEQKEYLAFGASAAGYANGIRYRNPDELDSYFERVVRKEEYIIDEELDKESLAQEFFILSLNKREGFSRAEFKEQFSSDWSVEVDEIINSLIEDGLLESSYSRYRLTKKGLDFVDMIMGDFLVDNLFK